MNENEEKIGSESIEKNNNELNDNIIDAQIIDDESAETENNISTSTEETYPKYDHQDDQFDKTEPNVYGNYYESGQSLEHNQIKQKKKVKKEKVGKNRNGKKFAKGLGIVASLIIIAFSGGVLGGYLANNTGSRKTAATTKTVNPANVAASEFLSSTSSSNSGTLTVAEAIEKVKPAVVTISTKTIVNNSNNNSFGNYGNSSGNGSGSTVEEGIGSGFIINQQGYIITNYHVISGSTEVKVLLSTGKEVGAKVVNYDEKKDIAMVKLDDGVTVPGVAELGDSDALYAGEEVIAIGTPLSTEFSATCTKGIISAINRNVQTDSGVTMNLIQTDAAINPGNSGGPLINTKGQVIGINNMKLVTTEVEGIGFAIPINEASDRIETLSKPIITLGISVVEITDELSKQNDLPKGLYVNDVTQFSAAEKGGIKIGDVITSFDGKKIQTVDDLSEAKAKKTVGDKVKVIVERNDKEVELDVTLQ